MDLMDYRRKIIANSPHLKSASGSIVSFSDSADLPLKSLIVDIEPVQSGSGDPSPTNIRPISGWSGVKVTRNGKNFLHVTRTSTTVSGVTFTVNFDGTIVASGTSTANIDFSLYTSASDGGMTGSYILSSDVINSSNSYKIVGRVTNKSTSARRYINTKDGEMPIATGENEIIDSIYINVQSGKTVNNVAFKPMLRLSSVSDSTYEPYNGVNVSIDLGQTVYGGTLNPLTGVLTAYPYYASYNGETLTGRWISDRDVYAVGTTPTIGAQVVDMSGAGTEIQLTPQQIRSLYGNNTIYADTGNVALEYWAHP